MADTVRVQVKKPTGTGRRQGWNKVVSRIDNTKQGGYAFEGRFLDERQVDLKVGSVLVGQIPVGSATYGNHWRVGVVSAHGVEWEDRTWSLDRFLDFRDHVETLMNDTHDDMEALRDERAHLVERIKEIDLLIDQQVNP